MFCYNEVTIFKIGGYKYNNIMNITKIKQHRSLHSDSPFSSSLHFLMEVSKYRLTSASPLYLISHGKKCTDESFLADSKVSFSRFIFRLPAVFTYSVFVQNLCTLANFRLSVGMVPWECHSSITVYDIGD